MANEKLSEVTTQNTNPLDANRIEVISYSEGVWTSAFMLLATLKTWILSSITNLSTLLKFSESSELLFNGAKVTPNNLALLEEINEVEGELLWELLRLTPPDNEATLDGFSESDDTLYWEGIPIGGAQSTIVTKFFDTTTSLLTIEPSTSDRLLSMIIAESYEGPNNYIGAEYGSRNGSQNILEYSPIIESEPPYIYRVDKFIPAGNHIYIYVYQVEHTENFEQLTAILYNI